MNPPSKAMWTALTVPAYSTSAVAVVLARSPDRVVADLGELVPDDEKPLSRLGLPYVADTVRAHGCGFMVGINRLERGCLSDDLETAVQCNADAVLVTCAGASELAVVRDQLAARESGMALWAKIERVPDLLCVDEVAATGVAEALVVGTEGLRRELGRVGGSSFPELFGIRRMIADAASRWGLIAVDGCDHYGGQRFGDQCTEPNPLSSHEPLVFAGRLLDYRPAHPEYEQNHHAS